MPHGKTFDATLGEVSGEIAESFGSAPRLRAPPPALDDGETPGGGGAYLWDQASRWVPEMERVEPPMPESPPPPPSGDPAHIARELAMARAATPDDWARLRRRFNWQNHPDRHPDWPEKLANRRVAIANMLIDEALEGLARAKRSK